MTPFASRVPLNRTRFAPASFRLRKRKHLRRRTDQRISTAPLTAKRTAAPNTAKH